MDKDTIKRLQQGEIPITLSFLQDDVIGVSGKILINAPPEKVWSAITDYDKLSGYLPKVLSSRLVSRDGNEIVLEQTGKTGILIFEKTVHFRLKAREDYLKKVSFEQMDGDFRIYRGEWTIETYPEVPGTVLFYRAEIKPVFFAPPILVSFVQYQDLPGILKAHKKRAENL